MKTYVLKAQNPSTQKWVELHRITTTTNYQNRLEGKAAIESASKTHPYWLLKWEIEE
jgi:hypothetical protein